MKKKTVKAYSYIRVSSKGQVSGHGFARQQKAITDYTAANGIDIVKTFKEEGVSGSIENRPALARLFVALEQNGEDVKTIIIERMDRLARDLMVQERIADDLKKQGVDLVSATEGADLLSKDATRTLVRHIFGAIAQYDKTMTVQKLRAARERVRARGDKCEGAKGYADVAPEIIKEIRRLRRKPRLKGMRRRSHQQVAEELNRQGLVTLGGKAFDGQTVQNILRTK